jgi:hypothetical protein
MQGLFEVTTRSARSAETSNTIDARSISSGVVALPLATRAPFVLPVLWAGIICVAV